MASDQPTEGRCGARIRNGPDAGRYCARYPRLYQDRCPKHGGDAPQNLKAAERRRQEAEARRVVARYGDAVPVDPADAIVDTLARLNGACEALRDEIAKLEPKALTWGKAEVTKIGSTQFPGVDKKFAAGINPLVELYERNLRELARLSVDALKVGVMLRREQRDADLADWLLERMLAFAAAAGLDAGKPEIIALASSALTGQSKPKAIEA